MFIQKKFFTYYLQKKFFFYNTPKIFFISQNETTDMNGKGGEIEYVESDPDLICLLCLSIFEDPIVHPNCGNMFCKQCSLKLDKCPLCRVHWDPAKTCQTPPIFVKKKLDELKVRCNFCSSETARGDYDSHTRKYCTNRIVDCPAKIVGCPWAGRNTELESHVSICHYVALEDHLLGLNQQIADLKKGESFRFRIFDSASSDSSASESSDSSDSESSDSSDSENSASSDSEKEKKMREFFGLKLLKRLKGPFKSATSSDSFDCEKETKKGYFNINLGTRKLNLNKPVTKTLTLTRKKTK